MNIGISNALQVLRPGATWSMDDQNYSSIQWAEDNAESLPSESDLEIKRDELRAAYDAQSYARSRRLEYPPVGDQLDALYHAGVFPNEMNIKLKSVKDKYPKK